MKKRLLFVAAILTATATFAQDGLTSKKGEAYLPEAGDWSIGFDASSFTTYVGNLANGGSNGALSMGWMNNSVGQEIRLKMFKDETTAYRLRGRIGTSSQSSDVLGKYDADADPTTADVDYTVTTKTSQGFSVILGAGIEKRRGNTRIQGYYGGEVYFGLLGGQTITTDDSRALTDDYTNGGAARQTEDKDGSTFTLGLGGFIGVEWFFAPKVSLGAEYGYGLGMTSTGEGETTTERWGIPVGSTATTNSLITETTKKGKSSAFAFDTQLRGNINLNFHF
ncbi:MAG: hypothetical protein H6586_05505 [Flavobacteriales bacterium]|nr:hypothetical protein [Flavobacteriales bacterium]